MQIGKDAFAGCVSVKEIYLDRSVQSIGDSAFAGLLTCSQKSPNSFVSIFKENSQLVILKMPLRYLRGIFLWCWEVLF